MYVFLAVGLNKEDIMTLRLKTDINHVRRWWFCKLLNIYVYEMDCVFNRPKLNVETGSKICVKKSVDIGEMISIIAICSASGH
jgi:hypothetical protein